MPVWSNIKITTMKLNIIGWVLALAGQILIALGFFCFFDVISLVGEDVCWLDFLTVSFVYWAWLVLTWRHPILTNDRSGRQASGLGIRWGALILYGVSAIIVIVAGLAMADDPDAFRFKWQLLIQLGLLFLFIVAIYVSAVTNAHSGQVFRQEETIREGKDSIRIEIQDLMYKADMTKGVPEEVKVRIHSVGDEVRYLSPNGSSEARRLDDEIVEDIRMLGYALTDYRMNSRQVSDLLDTLEQDFRRRKAIS